MYPIIYREEKYQVAAKEWVHHEGQQVEYLLDTSHDNQGSQLKRNNL